MKKFTLILFAVAFCIYIYHTRPDLVSKIINNETFTNLDLGLVNTKPVNLPYKSHNNTNNIKDVEYDNKFWNIDNTNYGLLDNGFINKKYNDMIQNKELGNDIIDRVLTNYEDEDDILIEENEDSYPPKSYYYNKKNYKLFGLGTNPYYNIYFIIYERPVNSENEIHNNKLYEYILLKKYGNSINVIQIYQPRDKITIGEYVTLSFGPSELSYILVSPIN
jgi:hypothetical protein